VRDGDEAAREFVERYDWTFPVIEDREFEQASKLRLVGHPAVMLIDADGRIVSGFYGPGELADWDELAAEL
jgi:hypothetical protein